MIKKIKQLFCKHEYVFLNTVRYQGGEKDGMEEYVANCRKCDKRRKLVCVGRSAK